MAAASSAALSTFGVKLLQAQHVWKPPGQMRANIHMVSTSSVISAAVQVCSTSLQNKAEHASACTSTVLFADGTVNVSCQPQQRGQHDQVPRHQDIANTFKRVINLSTYLADGTVKVYSRNSEDNTTKYPDIVASIPKLVKDGVRGLVLDCEAVAYDRKLGKLLPFQVSRIAFNFSFRFSW